MPTPNDSTRQFLDAFDVELERLGLDRWDIPGLAVTGGEKALEELLTHLRSLSPGATWHDVLPDLPRDWIPGRPETWIGPYVPLGSWDYQELPTGQAIRIIYRGEASQQSWLDPFIARARAASWPIYSAGFSYENKRDQARRWEAATIVLNRGTDDATFSKFLLWLESQSTVELAGISRNGEEAYRE